MRFVGLILLGAAALQAQTLTFSIQTSPTSWAPLGNSYQFPNTPQGSASSVVLEATNNSTATILMGTAWISGQAGSSQATPDFTLTGLAIDQTLAPGTSFPFTVSFTPSSTGTLTGFLQAVYLVQQNGCTLVNATIATQCPATTAAVATLTGIGSPAQLVLAYNTANGSQNLQPNATSPLDFGAVSVSSSKTITFTLSNQSGAAIPTPAISLQTPVFGTIPFSLDTSSVPATIAAGASATFNVTFAPGQAGLGSTTLQVGSNLYPLVGNGAVVSSDDALQISYVDSTGVRGLPQAATPINFGQLTASSGATNTLTFTVTNPETSFSPVMVDSITVSGPAFSLSGLPTLPASIAPGASITFAVSYAAGAQGNASGTLAIDSRVFSLSGQSVSLPLPSISLQVNPTPLTSQEQATLTIQLGTASSIDAIGQLAMTFTPSVPKVSDDPAIQFVATNSRQMQVKIASGSQTATFNNQSALTFQTGTTSGTITFTLTFPELAPITRSFTITPSPIVFTSATASWQEPNLVITVDGYDNTYTAGQLLFNFYDTSGNPIIPNGMAVNATTQFQNYFFTNNPVGGAFALQASFPVSGEDVSHIGSVSLTMSNSAGQTSTNRINQ
jgi:hypothetical protein